jgi:hypothetical protein
MVANACGICGRRLDNPADELSVDCAGHCWGCVGEAEADAGHESSLNKVFDEWRRGLRPLWVPPAERRPC